MNCNEVVDVKEHGHLLNIKSPPPFLLPPPSSVYLGAEIEKWILQISKCCPQCHGAIHDFSKHEISLITLLALRYH